MKSKRNKLIIGGVAGIVAMFLLSLFLPAFQPFAKAGALVIYALVNYVQIKEMKRNGQDIETGAFYGSCTDHCRLSAVFYIENGSERLTKDTQIGYTIEV